MPHLGVRDDVNRDVRRNEQPLPEKRDSDTLANLDEAEAAVPEDCGANPFRNFFKTGHRVNARMRKNKKKVSYIFVNDSKEAEDLKAELA